MKAEKNNRRKRDEKAAAAYKFIRDAGPRVRMNLEYIKTARPTVGA